MHAFILPAIIVFFEEIPGDQYFIYTETMQSCRHEPNVVTTGTAHDNTNKGLELQKKFKSCILKAKRVIQTNFTKSSLFPLHKPIMAAKNTWNVKRYNYK